MWTDYLSRWCEWEGAGDASGKAFGGVMGILAWVTDVLGRGVKWLI